MTTDPQSSILLLRSSSIIPCFIRGSLFLLLLLFSISACKSKAPYAGKSVSQLRRMLHHSDVKVQVQGAFGLSQLGPQAREAIPDLLTALKSDDALVRQNAALALGSIGPEAADAVPGLTDALQDGQWTVRRQAALALGDIGPIAKTALPELDKLKKDAHKRVADAAKVSAKKIRQTP
jgi:HEAT repeat protein